MLTRKFGCCRRYDRKFLAAIAPGGNADVTWLLSSQYEWDDRKCPKKGTPEWQSEVRKQLGNHLTGKPGKGAGGKVKKANQDTATAAETANKSGDAPGIKVLKQKAAKEATPSTSNIFKQLADVANDTGNKLKEVPQIIGQAINDHLPSGSRKESSGKPVASTGANTAEPLTEAARKAQQAIVAMSPARGSGTGKRAALGKKQDGALTKRLSRHAAPHAGSPSAVIVEDNDDVVDIVDVTGQKARLSYCSMEHMHCC